MAWNDLGLRTRLIAATVSTVVLGFSLTLGIVTSKSYDAARQQGVASEEVAISMQQITDLIEQNTSAARQASQAASELMQTSQTLAKLIGDFEFQRR